MLFPSKAIAIGLSPTSYSATILPSPSNFCTVLPSDSGDPMLVTHTCSPSYLTADGPSPTPKLASFTPSLDIFVTVSSVGFHNP